MANVTINKQTGNLEIVYKRKPAEATRATLHAAGFRWHEATQRWWGAATNERVAIAMRVDPDFRPVATARGKSLKGALAKPNGAGTRLMRFPEGTMTEAEWVRNHADRVEEVRESWLNLFDRNKFNRMDYAEQARYEAGLKKQAEKPVYRAWKGDKFYAVSAASYATRAAKANGAKRAGEDLPPLGQWNVYAGGTGAEANRKGYDYLPPGMHPHQKVSIEPVSNSMGRHAGYVVKSYNWKYPGHELISPAGQIRVNNGYHGDIVVRSAQEGLRAARAAWNSLGRGAKANDMAADFNRHVPMLASKPRAAAAPAAPPVWSKVRVNDEVEFHPHGKLALRGWAREITPHKNGPLLKLSGVKVYSPQDGGWINGSPLLERNNLWPALGTLAVLVPGTIVAQMAPGEVHGAKRNGRAGAKKGAKRNGNLGEELRDMRRPAKKTAKKTAAKRPGRAPAKKAAAPRAGGAPATYSVTGDAGRYDFMQAVKAARATVQQVGAGASRYHGGELIVRNLKTKKVVARWEVGPTGRFRQVRGAK